MSFDEIPENKKESYPCPECQDGNVTSDSMGEWECDRCDFSSMRENEREQGDE